MSRDFITAVACREDAEALDRLAFELRTNKRRRQMADGLPIAQAFDLWFSEMAGKVGSR